MKFRGPETVGEFSLDRRSVEALYRKKSSVSRILEIYAWLHINPGLKKRVNFANFRLPSPFASPSSSDITEWKLITTRVSELEIS